MKKKTGSIAMLMTYGTYLEKFPQGRKDADARAENYGYCVINNADNTNICWLSMADFHNINTAFKTLVVKEKRPRKRNGKAAKGA